MYNPVHFRIDDIAKIRQFIQANPLATIVATQAEHSEICPVPLVWLDDGSEFGCLIGHVARPNPLIKMADIPTWQVQFLHAGHYISPNWYPSKAQTHKEVPTWNYQAIHIYGKINFFTSNKTKLAAVGMLTKQSEQKANGASGWKMSDAPIDYLMEELAGIIVFEITISRIIAKSKLSQNRDSRDFNSVVKELQARGEHGVAESMLRLDRGQG